MTGIKTTNDRSSTWQEFLLAAMSLVLVLVMTGQGVVQAAGIGMPMSQPDTVSGSAEMSEHDHHRSHEHDVPALAASDEDAATDMLAHHAGHADGSGCCPMSVCGSACSGVCSGTGVGVPVATAALPTLSGLSRIGRAVTEDPVLARALGVHSALRSRGTSPRADPLPVRTIVTVRTAAQIDVPARGDRTRVAP